ncbi:MAG TPA: hypothetical protein VFQ79_20550 [Bryobacteraceae bacterium]|nr:hypothetical protein [Bryobacteraceae bacterium]
MASQNTDYILLDQERIGWMFPFATAAFSLIRMRNLLAATA